MNAHDLLTMPGYDTHKLDNGEDIAAEREATRLADQLEREADADLAAWQGYEEQFNDLYAGDVQVIDGRKWHSVLLVTEAGESIVDKLREIADRIEETESRRTAFARTQRILDDGVAAARRT